ncbi:MAG: 1-acyl-sn-glycerol-3-phosphate acyltransferase [Planctomycetes bacterium]|nr:1-acyl-sn-glycerol-3-phosphate acyltransferase [Planctomycetota bacterium]
MQDIIIEKPYQFIPPHRGRWFPSLMMKTGLVPWYLRRFEGVVSCRLEGVDHFRESQRRGYGVLLTPNHCRYADPVVLYYLAREAEVLMYAMASWHLFHQSRLQSWAIRTMGAFSVYREGMDRQALDLAVDVLSSSERPLVVFPEGAVFRTNDLLQPLLDGVSFMARSAAKRRVKEGNDKPVVIHPVAIKYVFKGDLQKAVARTLDSLEKRLTWTNLKGAPILTRIHRVTMAMLSLKEIEYLGSPQSGTIIERQQRLVDHLLEPIETEWLGKSTSGALIPRIKALRTKIVPELTTGELPTSERDRRWKHLERIYLAQQVASYPPDYLSAPTTDTRILETVERLEEDLTDRAEVHGPLEVVLRIGEAIPVPADRPPRGEEDPIMKSLREVLQSMLDELSDESRRVDL